MIRTRASATEFGDLVAAALDGSGVTAIEELEGGEAVRAFFAETADRDRAAQHVAVAFPHVDVAAVDVSDEDWAARSQASLRAVRVGSLTIAPPWDANPDDTNTLIVLPSTGFGTGHHATTRLCLGALQKADVEGKATLDVGTGSGVLALASAMLGANRVLAIDYDQDAIDNARENLELNARRIDRSRIEIARASIEDRSAVPAGAFDLVLANLTGATLIRFAPALKAACALGGTLIVSGLRWEEEEQVRGAFGWDVVVRTIEDGWLCLVTQRGL